MRPLLIRQATCCRYAHSIVVTRQQQPNSDTVAWRVWRAWLQEYDVLVTNPPFSGDHLHKILRYVLGPLHNGRPFLLLMPNYVCLKPFCRRAITTAAYTARQQQQHQHQHVPEEPLLLAPPSRYAFDDRGQRGEGTAEQQQQQQDRQSNQPYVCLWYVSGGRVVSNTDLLSWWAGLASEAKRPVADSGGSNNRGGDVEQGVCALAAKPAHLPPSALEGTNWVDPSSRGGGGGRGGGRGRGRGRGRSRGRGRRCTAST